MSIYNGFGTRQLEASYNKALYNTIFLLQLRIYKLFKGGKSKILLKVSSLPPSRYLSFRDF